MLLAITVKSPVGIRYTGHSSKETIISGCGEPHVRCLIPWETHIISRTHGTIMGMRLGALTELLELLDL